MPSVPPACLPMPVSDRVAGADGAAPAASERVASVGLLQDDLRVLIEHLANRPGKLDNLATASGAATATYAPTSLEVPAQLLVYTPEAIANDAALLGRLYASIGTLTSWAAPADVTSIRLTHAFVRSPDQASFSPNIVRDALRLRRWAWASAGFGLVLFLSTILLLIHIDRGRRTVQQLQEVRLATQAALSDLSVARTASANAGAGVPLSCASPAASAGSEGSAAERSGRQEHLLCGRLDEARFRMRLVHQELQMWNIASDRLSYVSPIAWVTPTLVPSPDLSEHAWQSTELRTSVLMTAMTGFVLPMLLGLLGACVYVYREIDDAIQTATLAAREGVHGTLRMLLGAILGGLLGALWTNGQAIQLEGVSLSLGALAFFVGFSVEVVFRLVDALVRTVADRLSKPAA